MENNLSIFKHCASEYLKTLIPIGTSYLLNDKDNTIVSYNLRKLEVLYKKIDNINSVEEIDSIIKDADNIQEIIENEINNNFNNVMTKFIGKKDVLTSREQALVERGYDENLVRELAYFPNESLNSISDLIIKKITDGCIKISNPKCIFIGGQPGCGKTTISTNIKNSDFKKYGAVEIGIDNYRSYHPNYLRIEKAIKEHWNNRVQTVNDTPGNDIADFTHKFAGDITDILSSKISEKDNNKNYNIVFEWGMRKPDEPLKTLKEFKEKGYCNIINFVAVSKDISYESCELRTNIMGKYNHIIRKVPKYFHDICIESLPDSCEKIYNTGYLIDKSIDKFIISTRDGESIWDKNSNYSPKEIYDKYLNN